MNGIFQHPWMKSFEQVYNISILSYVQQQDEQIREMKRMEEKKILPQELTNYQERKPSTDAISLVSVVDQTSPLIIKSRIPSDSRKKMSFNGSTKESEGSTGSEKSSPTLDYYLNSNGYTSKNKLIDDSLLTSTGSQSTILEIS